MTKLKVGIIGGGAIAQIQHLPILRERADEFEIGGLADLSPQLLATVGDEYQIPLERRFRDYHDLVQSDIDAVIVCPSGSHAAPSIAASQAGKHVLVEKPMCTTVDEARKMVEAAAEANTILMVAYMKRYDPAYIHAHARIAEMSDIRFVQVNHLHPDNALHVGTFKVHRFDDIPQNVREESTADHARLVAQALDYPAGQPVPPDILRAYTTILGSMIHDIGNLHGAFGSPSRVISTEIWADGTGISTTLEYTDGKRAVCTWVDLPELWEFKETMEVYGSRERVIASFPTGFSKGWPSTVIHHGMDSDRTPWKEERVWHENPFELEVRHFRDSILAGQRPNTDAASAIEDIALVRDIVLAYLNR